MTTTFLLLPRSREADPRGTALGAALAGLCLFLLFATPLRAQLSVQPVLLQFDARVGGSQELRVTNGASEPAQFDFYREDFDHEVDGAYRILGLGEHPRSCGGRLDVFPSSATLAGGESTTIRVELAPGGTCWSIVFAQRGTVVESGIRVGQRVGVKIYAVDARDARDARLDSLRVRVEGDTARVRFRVRNTGGVPYGARPEVELRSLEGEVLSRVAAEPVEVHPERSRRLEMALPAGVEPGTYLVVPIVDVGAEHLIGAQEVIEIRPDPPTGGPSTSRGRSEEAAGAARRRGSAAAAEAAGRDGGATREG